ncbi:MAG TPA: hypothetical protein DFS52_24820 [Myxococcales bacterium]|jgi:hypothetical protein|nr:hypothetical protein [Myxococcales bacterium]
MRALFGALAFAVAAAGCSGADLPKGWEDAERVSLNQGECEGNPYEGEQSSVQVSAFSKGIDVACRKAHFRCEQEVEAFVRESDGRIDLLFQPVDMDPGTVAKCDCLYDLTVALEKDPGSYEVRVFRRWDNLNEPNEPVKIGSGSVAVP